MIQPSNPHRIPIHMGGRLRHVFIVKTESKKHRGPGKASRHIQHRPHQYKKTNEDQRNRGIPFNSGFWYPSVAVDFLMSVSPECCAFHILIPLLLAFLLSIPRMRGHEHERERKRKPENWKRKVMTERPESYGSPLSTRHRAGKRTNSSAKGVSRPPRYQPAFQPPPSQSSPHAPNAETDFLPRDVVLCMPCAPPCRQPPTLAPNPSITKAPMSHFLPSIA
jgi:hypothetical protein